MVSYKVAVIPGDGIGPEIIREGVKVVDAAAEACGFEVEWDFYDFGAERYLRTGKVMDEDDLRNLSRYKAIYLGAVGDPRVEPGVLEIGIVLAIRFYFDQYINLRPVKLLRGVRSLLRGKGPEDINFVVVRENVEDFYIGMGGRVVGGSHSNVLRLRRRLYSADFRLEVSSDYGGEIGYQLGVMSYRNAERVFRFSFEYARRHGMHKVSLVDKANVLPHIYGTWRRAFRDVAREYPDIETEMLFADATAMWMVKNPEKFELIVAPNLFGDILTDLGAAIQGGLGLAPSGNINPEGTSMFEPMHGSAPKYKGLNVANPIATILAGALMLEFLGEEGAARLVERAVEEVLAEGKVRTRDLGGSSKTSEMGDAIASKVRSLGETA